MRTLVLTLLTLTLCIGCADDSPTTPTTPSPVDLWIQIDMETPTATGFRAAMIDTLIVTCFTSVDYRDPTADNVFKTITLTDVDTAKAFKVNIPNLPYAYFIYVGFTYNPDTDIYNGAYYEVTRSVDGEVAFTDSQYLTVYRNPDTGLTLYRIFVDTWEA